MQIEGRTQPGASGKVQTEPGQQTELEHGVGRAGKKRERGKRGAMKPWTKRPRVTQETKRASIDKMAELYRHL